MKKIVMAAMIAVGTALVPHTASAKDFCFALGLTDAVFKAFTVPGKGACKPATEISADFPGLVASGSACTTTDGTTLLFDLSDAYFDDIEEIQGSITLASKSGSGVDCTASSGGNDCEPFTIAVETCPKKATAIAAVDFSAKSSGLSVKSQAAR